MSALVPLDSSVDTLTPAMREVAVSTYLEHAKSWLATAVEQTGPEQIAAAKAEIATAAEATKQLHLSKDIQLDAQEMVRRAEYALGKAIRKGQAEGSIASTGDIGGVGIAGVRGGVSGRSRGDHLDKPHEVAGEHKAALSAIYQMSDGVEPDQFNEVLDDAKLEGNLSRANVVRKVKGGNGVTAESAAGVGPIRSPAIRQQRADLIADLAAQGYSSRQMPAKVGVTEESVRQIARDFGIEIPADRSIGRTRRINSTDVVVNTATALEGLLVGVELVVYEELDPEVANEWVASIKDSLRILNRFAKKVEEVGS